MRAVSPLLALVPLALLAACSTPQSRIADHRPAFEKYPVEVQQKISAGQVDVGFTQEMVLIALGEPDRKFTRKTETGEVEVWGYHDNTPHISFGVGVSSGSGGYNNHTATSTGVAVSSGGYDPEEKIRVEFRAGTVTAVDTLK